MAKVALPRYMRARKLQAGLAYYWEPPHWARKGALRNERECPVVATALGLDLAAALAKANHLNEALDGWRQGEIGSEKMPGTVSWLFDWYMQTDRFRGRSGKTQSDYRKLMNAIAETPMKVGVFGQRNAAAIDGEVADKLYKKFRERGERQATYAMQVCRLVWNWAGRYSKKTGIPEGRNPFAKMALNHKVAQGNRAATRQEYDLYRQTARELGFQSMATAAALAFELIQRVSDVFGFEDPGDGSVVPADQRGILWEDYVATHRITVRQQKTHKLVSIPLADGFGEDRVYLYPELEAELKAWADIAPSNAGLIIVEERNGQPYKPRRMSEVHRRICDQANLPQNLTFTSFRHGGATELGNAGELDIRSISGHTQLSTTLIYNQANEVKARRLARSRRAHLELIAGNGERGEADDA